MCRDLSRRRIFPELNIDPNRIGIIGFSAGANLTIRTSTNWKKSMYAKVEADVRGTR